MNSDISDMYGSVNAAGSTRRQKTGDRRPETGGFTLIEFAVAMLVFAIGITGAMKMQTLSIKGNAYGMNMTCAVNAAQDEIERLMGFSYIHTSLSAGVHGITAAPTTSTPVVKWSVTDNTPISNVKTIGVTASWLTPGEPVHQITLTFMKNAP